MLSFLSRTWANPSASYRSHLRSYDASHHRCRDSNEYPKIVYLPAGVTEGRRPSNHR